MRPRCTVMHSAAGALFTLYASTQTRVFSISPKMYCIQSCTQKQAKNRIAKDRKPQQYDLTRDLGKEPARSIQGHDIKHQPCSIFQPMLSWRKAYLLHHPAEQCTKSRHCNNKLHQVAYRKFKNPIANYWVKQQPFHSPPKKEIQRCNKPEVIRSSQCFQTWLDLFHKGLCVRNRMKQFLIIFGGNE